MKWILIIGAGGLGLLYWRGGGDLAKGFSSLKGDLHLGPCTDCAGKANAASGTAVAPQPIMLGD